jgi:hypothetical protein
MQLGTRVNIKKSIGSPYAGEWGIIRYYDGQDYHVGLWGSDNETIIFNKKEITKAK